MIVYLSSAGVAATDLRGYNGLRALRRVAGLQRETDFEQRHTNYIIKKTHMLKFKAKTTTEKDC